MVQLVVAEPDAEWATPLRQLAERQGWPVTEAANRASPAVNSLPSLWMTSGQEQVQPLSVSFPFLPVLIVAREDAVDVAARLQSAMTYLRRDHLEDDFAALAALWPATASNEPTTDDLLDRGLLKVEWCYALPNQGQLITALVRRLRRMVAEIETCDDLFAGRVATAVWEALQNAIVHGNLEVSAGLRETSSPAALAQFIQQRRQQRPYRDRRVWVSARMALGEVCVLVRDEGSGHRAPSPHGGGLPPSVDPFRSRGQFLMQALADEVRYNEIGNEVTLVFRPPIPIGQTGVLTRAIDR